MVTEIERHARIPRAGGRPQPAAETADPAASLPGGLLMAARVIGRRYPRRALLGAILMLAQAFF